MNTFCKKIKSPEINQGLRNQIEQIAMNFSTLKLINNTTFLHNLLPSRLYCRLRNQTESAKMARGLYRRWGITPRPEDFYLFKINTDTYLCQYYVPSGNSTVKLLPIPSLLIAYIRPAWASTSALVIASPIPVPPVFLALDLSTL